MTLKHICTISRFNNLISKGLYEGILNNRSGSLRGSIPLSSARLYSTEKPEDTQKPKSIPQKARGLVSSFIHGAPEVVQDLERSTYSKIIARGKYVHQIEFHYVKPEAQEEYSGLINEYYPKLLTQYGSQGMKLYGSWVSEIGELDKAVHIWEYDGYSAYDGLRAKLSSDALFKEFQRKLGKTLRSREKQMCLEFAFWASSPPKFNGGVYELRTYLLKPGRLLEWEQNWKVGLECRRQFTEPVGAWFSQLGDLNYVHHMWIYPDLQKRKETREQAWKVDGWAETVYNTVRLVETMQSTVLVPMDVSPLK